jgi:hypothetical protein
MNIIKVRSPFIVTVAEAGQDGSKIELFIWNKGTTEPATPTYTLSKSIPSASQIDNIYNISNYIREYISNVKPVTVTLPTVDDNTNWVYCKVKRYKLVGTTYTLLDTTEYVCVDGFTLYSDGKQSSINVNALALSNGNIITKYTGIPYVNVLAQRIATYDFTANYYTKANVLIEQITLITNGAGSESFLFKVPLRSTLSTDDYQNLILKYNTNVFEKSSLRIEECKYTPVTCTFINRYGGWEFLTFFKQQINTIAVKGTDYKLMPSSVNYNTSLGQSKTFNINGTQTIKLNTGFVDENYSELITDLLLSETVLLDSKPVIVKTQGSDLKTNLKDRLINYEMEFEYAYNLINDVI